MMYRLILCVTLWLAAAIAQAVSVERVTPQGEVSQVRQITVKFSEAVVPMGNPRLPDPLQLTCNGGAPQGSGRWVNDRSWVYDFREVVPPGVRCALKIRDEWKPLATSASGSSVALIGATAWTFSTGGPAVVSVQPWEGSQITEDQHFLLTLSGPATSESVTTHAWCEVQGIGERLPVTIVTGPAREALLKARRIDKKRAERMLLLACTRPLPPDAGVRLIWGNGIAAAGNPQVATRTAQRYRFTVRKAFTAEFSCERERASAPCMPIRPMVVRFSAPVARKWAAQMLLRPSSGAALSPVFDKDDKSEQIEEARFPFPLPESTTFTVELPRELKDDADRPLANASMFPLKVATGDTPPIAKFAAAPFGIVELASDSTLPVTLRHVQGDLRPPAGTSDSSSGVRIKRLETDADILSWYEKVGRYNENTLTAREAGLPQKEWFTLEEAVDAQGRPVKRRVEREVQTRELSLLNGASDAKRLELPQVQGGGPWPFEVVGIPLPGPGYYVVEIESRRLGESLLDKRAPMYVRTGALVTNLGVHLKVGRENALVWVTTLEKAKPVEAADVAVNDCRGQRLWAGRTDAVGIARIDHPLPRLDGGCPAGNGYFVTARKAIEAGPHRGTIDVAFVFSQWQKGIEPWRFNVATSREAESDVRAHTVFDRTLLRAGETVSMKHFVRAETSTGLRYIDSMNLPTRVKIVHDGSHEEFVQPLQWNGQRSAVSSWTIPPAAKLGSYTVRLERDPGPDAASSSKRSQTLGYESGEFRVEEFRVPLVDARVNGPKAVQVAPSEIPLSVQLSYFSGGGMSQAAARASVLLTDRAVEFPGYNEFSFEPPRKVDNAQSPDEPDSDTESRGESEAKLVGDKLPITTDKDGAATVTLKDLPKISRASVLRAEVTFNDPNGEVQTAATRIDLWPSAVVVGIKASSWVSNRGRVAFTALALDTSGKPLRRQSLLVRGRLMQIISTRKRIVGGFYAYDNRSEVRDLGELCSGSTDDRGLLVCDASLTAAGQVELIAQAEDGAGNVGEAATTIWVTRQGELWFGQDNDDRIDILPEKKSYEPGETARLQVRMPFREATALVAVEREGIIDTRVVTLRGDDPTVDLKIDKTWSPNIYVSVLALRGRIRDVPWYSFFTWGWKEPLNWARSFWYEGREYQAPTAMVDLAKPAFKLGVAAIQVGIAEHALEVSVASDKPQYAIRQKALVRIKVMQHGKPVSGTEVAFAAVDEGLLALASNRSWDLLHGMIHDRPWGVATSTGQSEIIGRRHYGRKAVPAGGGGGRGGTRELFDTLLLWKAAIVPDANGEATVEVPLNDSLTSFRLVAVADDGAQSFGTSSATIRVTQDLQILSGLPPLVRNGDEYTAIFTLRNTTTREMAVHATLAATPESESAAALPAMTWPAQDVTIPAQSAREASWNISVPADAAKIGWDLSAEEERAGTEQAKDRIKVSQRVVPAVPLAVQQATLSQLADVFTLPVAAPGDALPQSGVKRGGLVIGVEPRLTGALPGIRRFFERYPYGCLEQRVSIAIGLGDTKQWTALANALPTYLDSNGLANYFPPRAEDRANGSDRLTAYVLAASNEIGFDLPQEPRDRMLDGLMAFVEGRIERRFWSPRPDLDVRKIAAIDALSRYGRATPRMLGSINLTPNLWPTAAVIDWLDVVKRMPAIPDAAARIAEAQQILRGRMTYAGTTMKFSTEDGDYWWWLMDNPDANAAKLILAMLDDPAWRDDLPRMVVGSLGRQRGGAWATTTANAWGAMALTKFSAKFESAKITGKTKATLSTATDKGVVIDWSKEPGGATLNLPWPDKAATLSVAQEGDGKPWLAVQSLAAVPLTAPFTAGYGIARTVTAIEQKDKSKWSRGDVMRVRIEIDAAADMTWVVVSDPVPAGASLLGSGLGRDSAIATRTERREGNAWPAYEERSFEVFRSYYGYLPRGKNVLEYTLRLGNAGRFLLPPTRVEALYAPENFGALPNAPLEVVP
jgi:uncharacterized protein YfaS (alpha-2-macroglobulin family)